MKIGRLFAALKKTGLGQLYTMFVQKGAAFFFGWLSMMDDIKKAVTQMFCVKMALIASLSCCSGSTYKMVWLFMSFFAKAKSSIRVYFYIRSTSCPLFFIMDSKFVQMTLLFFSLKDQFVLDVVKVRLLCKWPILCTKIVCSSVAKNFEKKVCLNTAF